MNREGYSDKLSIEHYQKVLTCFHIEFMSLLKVLLAYPPVECKAEILVPNKWSVILIQEKLNMVIASEE